MKKRTFAECLRLNIEDNWNDGGFFESMTKADCLKACDKIEQLEAELDKAQDQLSAYQTVRSPTNPLWLENKQLKAENSLSRCPCCKGEFKGQGYTQRHAHFVCEKCGGQLEIEIETWNRIIHPNLNQEALKGE